MTLTEIIKLASLSLILDVLIKSPLPEALTVSYLMENAALICLLRRVRPDVHSRSWRLSRR